MARWTLYRRTCAIDGDSSWTGRVLAVSGATARYDKDRCYSKIGAGELSLTGETQWVQPAAVKGLMAQLAAPKSATKEIIRTFADRNIMAQNADSSGGFFSNLFGGLGGLSGTVEFGIRKTITRAAVAVGIIIVLAGGITLIVKSK